MPELWLENEAKCEVALIGIQNKEPNVNFRSSVLESEKLFVGEKKNRPVQFKQ